MPKRSDIKSILIIGAMAIVGFGSWVWLMPHTVADSTSAVRIYICPDIGDSAALEACAAANLIKLQRAGAKPVPATAAQLKNAYEQLSALNKQNAPDGEPVTLAEKYLLHQLGELFYHSTPEFVSVEAKPPSEYDITSPNELAVQAYSLLSDGKFLVFFWDGNTIRESVYGAAMLDSSGGLELLRKEVFVDKETPMTIATPTYFTNPVYSTATGILTDSSRDGAGFTFYRSTYKLEGNLFVLQKEIKNTTDEKAGDDAEVGGIETILYERKH